MRLHNRQIKAAFWTDTDLIRHLDRDGRMFYIGSIQLADDSGCLEDDPLAFKLHLYPGDMDVDLDFIQRYRDKLVEIDKLIPYESCGKKGLFIKNFHKHQSLKNPAPPGVPLPEWLTWEAFKSNPKAGKYTINHNILNGFLESSYEVLTTFFQPEPEPEPEPNINNNDHDTASVEIAEVYKCFEQEFARPLSPMEIERVSGWINEVGTSLTIEALRRSVLSGNFNFKYMDKIVLGWKKKNVRTLQEVAELDKQFEQNRQNKNNSVKSSRASPDEKLKRLEAL